jgi:hypothetical protein
MTIEQGWTSSASELLRYRILNWTVQNPDVRMQAGVIAEALGVGRDDVADALALLKRAGLAADHGDPRAVSVTAWEAQLTAEGRTLRATLGTRHAVRAARLSACSDALLDWLYSHDGDENLADYRISGAVGGLYFSDDTRASYFGIAIPFDDIATTTRTLRTAGLVNGIGTGQGVTLRLEITQEGRDVVEDYDGSYAAWRKRDQRAGGDIININNSQAVNVAIRSSDLRQKARFEGTPLADALAWVDRYESQLPDLELDEDDTAQAKKLIAELRDEAGSAEPKMGRIRRAIKGLGMLALAALGNAVGAGLFEGAQALLEALPT